MKCQHCDRSIVLRNGEWIDPYATGDDFVWTNVCDSHDTFRADHEPQTEVPE